MASFKEENVGPLLNLMSLYAKGIAVTFGFYEPTSALSAKGIPTTALSNSGLYRSAVLMDHAATIFTKTSQVVIKFIFCIKDI